MQDIENLYIEYFQTVFKYLFCLSHDAELSEELTQETFYQSLKSYKNFRGDCKVSVWLCQIAKHLWYKECKKRGRYKFECIDEMANLIPTLENIEDSILEADTKISLYKRIQKLDDKTREVVYLRLTGELSFKEIGEILMKNETWARVTFYRGKQKLMEEGPL